MTELGILPVRPRPSPEQAAEFLAVDETAALLGVSVRTVWRWVHGGGLRTFRAGSITRIRRPELEAWLEEHTSGSSAAG